MPEVASGTLFAATETAFEQLGFLFVEPALEPQVDDAAPMVGVRIDFEGPFRGALVLRVGEDVLPELTANMLGEGPTSDPELLLDALGEVANVICGNALPMIAGPSVIFHLAAPRPEAEPGTTYAVVDRVEVVIDAGRGEVLLLAEPGARVGSADVPDPAPGP